MRGLRSFKANAMVDMLRRIRREVGGGHKICVFWDNATYHRAQIVKTEARKRSVNIKLVYNVPYRPDLCGIEIFWMHAKNRYRQWVDSAKVLNRTWDQDGMVENVLEDIDDEVAMKAAERGW